MECAENNSAEKTWGDQGRKNKKGEEKVEEGGFFLKLHLVGGNRCKRFQYQYQIVLKKVDFRIPVVPRLRSGHLAGEVCHEKAR